MVLTSTQQDIFQLLKQNGPMCASQLSVELLVPLREVNNSLIELKKNRIVERRSDHDNIRKYSSEEQPWGLAISFFG
jgi:predicted ArsR family transcriptional regulator